MASLPITLETISSGTLEIWRCSKCGQMLGTVTPDCVLITHRGTTIGCLDVTFRICQRCGEQNITRPLDKRPPIALE